MQASARAQVIVLFIATIIHAPPSAVYSRVVAALRSCSGRRVFSQNQLGLVPRPLGYVACGQFLVLGGKSLRIIPEVILKMSRPSNELAG
jgi:hypothetical protein